MSKLCVTDVKPETLERLVDYIYTDNSESVDRMTKVMLAASQLYQLPGLKSRCETHLGEMICPDNVANVLLLADKYKCQVSWRERRGKEEEEERKGERKRIR